MSLVPKYNSNKIKQKLISKYNISNRKSIINITFKTMNHVQDNIVLVTNASSCELDYSDSMTYFID